VTRNYRDVDSSETAVFPRAAPVDARGRGIRRVET
jgi:hypothetical protein